MGFLKAALTGVLLITVVCGILDASDSCSEETARLRLQEEDLKARVLKQEQIIQSLRQRNILEPARTPEQTSDAEYRDCSEVFRSGSRSSGVFSIRTRDSAVPFRVFCDMTEGGGWTVIQRRTDGTQNFNRSWSEYKAGFGDMQSPSGEFWLGNDNLHYLTAQGDYTLRINLEDFERHQRYADYKNFTVANEQYQYQLGLGAYSGTAGDALSGSYEPGVSDWASHQGALFSTYDRDNDNYRGNCALEDKGGWWFNKCHSAHLNGLYYQAGAYSAMTDDGVVWYTWRGWWYSLKTSVMKIRPTDFRIDPNHDPNAVQRRIVN